MPLVEPPVKRAADNILLNIKRRERLQMLGRNLRIGMVKKYPASRRNRGPRIQLPAAIGLVSFQAGRSELPQLAPRRGIGFSEGHYDLPYLL